MVIWKSPRSCLGMFSLCQLLQYVDLAGFPGKIRTSRLLVEHQTFCSPKKNLQWYMFPDIIINEMYCFFQTHIRSYYAE